MGASGARVNTIFNKSFVSTRPWTGDVAHGSSTETEYSAVVVEDSAANTSNTWLTCGLCGDKA